MDKTFLSKVGEILTSPRFWCVGIASIFWGLMSAGIIPDAVAQVVISWMLGTAGVGTIDRLGTK